MKTDCDWVGCVLFDVMDFLVKNQMHDSARMFAVAAAHIEHDIKKQEPIPTVTVALETKVLAFR
jgi:hypothetical protein